MFNARRRDFLNNTVIGDAHELHMVRTNPRYTEYENDYSQQEFLSDIKTVITFRCEFCHNLFIQSNPIPAEPKEHKPPT